MAGLGDGYQPSSNDVLNTVHRGFYFPEHKALEASLANETLVWTPASGKKVVVTDIVLSAASAVSVKFGFGPDSGNITYVTAAIQLTANNLLLAMTNLNTPMVAPNASDNFYVHLSGAVQLGGFVAGFEKE